MHGPPKSAALATAGAAGCGPSALDEPGDFRASALPRGTPGVAALVREAGGFLVHQDVGVGKGGADASLHLVGDLVRLLEIEIPLELEMQFDEHVRPGAPRAQIVHV